jgi:signal transduction histidine kinase
VSLRALLTGTIVVLMLAILASAVGTLLVRQRVDTIRDQSRTQLRPAQQAADALTTAYVDQETSQRGYLLTGDPTYLRAYVHSRHTITRLQGDLVDLLVAFPTATDRLETIVAAGSRWQATADLQISARSRGSLSAAALATDTRASQPMFANLRHDLDALNSETAQLLAQLIVRFDAAQHQADVATIAAVTLAILTALLCVLAIRRLLTRPLKALMDNVRTVAAGAYQQPIRAEGSGEIALIAEAVEGMRQNILTSSQALLDAHDELTVRDERARMAADLHDLTLQNVFALGVRIDGLAATNPTMAARLRPLLDDIAQIDRELRTIVYANSAPPTEGTLRARIATVTDDSRRSLGFVPVLRLDGPLDSLTGHPAAEDMLAALRETLSNIARHAHATTATVTVTLADARLHLQVTDNGIGMPADPTPGNGLRNLSARAASHSGTVTTTSIPGHGTTIDWRISVRAPGGGRHPARLIGGRFSPVGSLPDRAGTAGDQPPR